MSDQPSRRGAFRQLLGRMYRHRLLFLSACAALLVNTLCAVAAPRVIGWIVDSAVIPGALRPLAIGAAAFLLLEVVRLFSAVALSVRFSRLGQSVMNDLRVELFTKILSLPVLDSQRHGTGALTARVTSDISALSAMFEAGFLRIIERVFTVAGIVIGVLAIEPALGLSALILMPLFLVLAAFVTRTLFCAYHVIRERTEALSRSLSESLQGLAVIRLFGLEALRSGHYAQRSGELRDIALVPPRMFGLLHPAMTMVIGFSVAVLLWRGSVMVQAGTMTPGLLMALLNYVIWIFWPILFIVNQWNVFLQGLAAAQRIFDALGWPSEPDDEGPSDSAALRGAISFENVSYLYPGGSDGVHQLNCEIRPGEKIGIVGATGSGKTTLVRLLLRFIEPLQGAMRIDGRDIRAMDTRALRRQIGFVTQHPWIRRGSVVENIALWDDLERGVPAALEPLPPSVRALVAARDAAELSAGQRQILSFLRAAARAPDLWVLDEPSASIDPLVEEWLTTSLDRLARDRTVIIIAHRLTTLRSVDRILVMSHGRIAESGTHTELIAAGGLYRRLYELQAVEEEAGVVGI